MTSDYLAKHHDRDHPQHRLRPGVLVLAALTVLVLAGVFVGLAGQPGQGDPAGHAPSLGAKPSASPVAAEPGVAAAASGSPVASTSPVPGASLAAIDNLARNRSVTAQAPGGLRSSASALTDGDVGGVWQGAGFPQVLVVDLGAATTVARLVLRLPRDAVRWPARVEVLAVAGSADAVNYQGLLGSAGYTFDPAKGNVVTLPFVATRLRYLRLTITANSVAGSAQLAEIEAYRAAAAGTAATATNIALHCKATSTSDRSAALAAAAVTDGSAVTYWESANDTLPQSVTVDLASPSTVRRLVLATPKDWTVRTETFTVLGSTDGTTFSILKPSTAIVFDPATGNTATITLTATTVRFVRLTVTANSGWPAAQLAEFAVWTA